MSSTDIHATPFEASITLLGCGRMGLALLRGWVAHGFDPALIQIVEPHPSEDLLALVSEWSLRLRGLDEAEPSIIVVVALKPQAVAGVAPLCAHFFAPGAVVLSIMAGTTLASLRRLFPAAVGAVRTMPNLAAMVGAGMAVLVADADCSRAQRALSEELMSAVGSALWLPEEAMIDAACAVSGSGPAYAFLLVECLAKGGERQGLPSPVAARLARMTLIGAGAVLRCEAEEPGELRQQVTSPGGTTQAGLEILMRDDALDELVTRTVEAAARRSRELGGAG